MSALGILNLELIYDFHNLLIKTLDKIHCYKYVYIIYILHDSDALGSICRALHLKVMSKIEQFFGLRRRRTGLLPSGPKSSFQMRASFVFHLETKVLVSGGRVEKLVAQVAWSPVLSFHSLWWFGVQCHLLVLVHCVFWKPTSLHSFTKKCWSTSCFLLLTSFLKMLISFSSRICHLAILPKAPKVGLMTMVLVCLTGQQTHRTWTQ